MAERQTTQWLKEKWQKTKQWSTKHHTENKIILTWIFIQFIRHEYSLMVLLHNAIKQYGSSVVKSN
jgi:hypothetical protein